MVVEVFFVREMRDLTGVKISMVTMIEFSHKTKTGRYWRYFWKCKCECGNEFVRCSASLLRNKDSVKSCGCYNERFLRELRTKHSKTDTRIYTIWCSMKQRVTDPNSVSFIRYGGRGIKISDDWIKNFEKFYEDMNESYEEHVKKHGEKNTTLERIDSNGNYTKENCTWATYQEQSNNTRNLKPFRAENINTGEVFYRKSKRAFCREVGIGYSVNHAFKNENSHAYGYKFKHISEEEYQKELVQIAR